MKLGSPAFNLEVRNLTDAIFECGNVSFAGYPSALMSNNAIDSTRWEHHVSHLGPKVGYSNGERKKAAKHCYC